jgi:LPS-assembly protein
MFGRAYFWSILVGVVLWSSSTLAGVPSIGVRDDVPYHIKADSLSYDDTTKTYSARGHVTITSGNQSLQADAVDLNTQTMEAEASGNVYFTSDQDWLTGTRLRMNLDKGVGTLYDGTLFIQESHFYIRGGKIEKTGEDSYYINDGRFTACDGDSPAWKVTGKDLKVTIDGYGTIKHAALWVKSAPVLYTPFFLFPAKVTRQTGLLFPKISTSSRNGFTYSQPFFWAISDSSDATFYESYMEDRGFKHGVEYRYALTPVSKGAVMYDYLRDQQVDDGTGDFEGFTEDNEDRTNRDRWWLRAKSDQELPAGFRTKLDIDLVSDQDYLREFRDGYSDFSDTNDYFEEQFGRDLDDYTDTVRLNQLNLNRNWDQYSLNADLRWYDNVIARKNNDPDTTLQRLPHIQFDGSKQQLLLSPFYFDLESYYDYFWRDYGTKGHRAYLHPRLYYPVRIFKYFDFEPSVGLRETLWNVEEYENETPKKEDELLTREAYDFKADLSTEFWKTFHVKGKSIDRIRHSIKPQVVYDYISVPEDEDYPYFEGIDRTQEENLVTYSLTNLFTARSIQKPTQDPETNLGPSIEPEAPAYGYRDFCRIKLSQSYDIKEARRDDGVGDRRPFSDIKGEIEFKPYACLNLDGDAAWSPYDSQFTSYNAILKLCDKRGDWVSFDYRYTRDMTESVITRGLVKLLYHISAYGQYERNIQESQSVRTVVGFIYEPQCWSLNFSYTDDAAMDDQEFSIAVSLSGLGELGL